MRYDFDMIRRCVYAGMGLLCCLTIRGFGQASDAQCQVETLLREAHRLLGENKPDAFTSDSARCIVGLAAMLRCSTKSSNIANTKT